VPYFDYNATTPLHPEVAQRMADSLKGPGAYPQNASSIHHEGREARKRLETARRSVANLLGCEPREICFTGSGTEANALALLGAFRARKDTSQNTLVVSAIEHPAVLMAARQVEKEGGRVVFLRPDAQGRVSEAAVEQALTDEVFLCSLMWANNETGVLQPARHAALVCQHRRILFHCDAVQAAGKVEVNLREVNADLLVLTAHKFGGPPGVGVLVKRRSAEVSALVSGHQENGLRGGTHNLLYAEALAWALEVSARKLEASVSHMVALRDFLEAEVVRRIPGAVVNGGAHPRVPNTTKQRFTWAPGVALLIALDLAGFRVSTGAACASGSLTPSHVLTAMGLSAAEASASVRISLGPTTQKAEVEALVAQLVEQVPRARAAAVGDP
jgi:cysteine desulfurase